MPSLLPTRSRASFDLSNTFFVAALFCMGITEAFVISGLRFHGAANHRHGGFDLPFLVWIPSGTALLFLQLIRKRTKEGHITPTVATTLSSGLAFLLLVAYLLITGFAQIAFR